MMHHGALKAHCTNNTTTKADLDSIQPEFIISVSVQSFQNRSRTFCMLFHSVFTLTKPH